MEGLALCLISTMTWVILNDSLDVQYMVQFINYHNTGLAKTCPFSQRRIQRLLYAVCAYCDETLLSENVKYDFVKITCAQRIISRVLACSNGTSVGRRQYGLLILHTLDITLG